MVVNKALTYCNKYINDKRTGKYVRKQMEEFINICEGHNPKYMLDEQVLSEINYTFSKCYLPNYSPAVWTKRPTLYEGLNGFQWMTIIPPICVVHRDNPVARRYSSDLLLAGRQNWKTTAEAAKILLEFMLRPSGSRFFSVSYTLDRGKILLQMVKSILKVSPELAFRDKFCRVKRFEVTDVEIRMPHRDIMLKALPSSRQIDNTSAYDSYANCFTVVDEVGMFDADGAVKSLQTGQTRQFNGLCSMLSTRHHKGESHYFEKKISEAKTILDGGVVTSPEIDETQFALLYEPDEPEKWRTDDTGLYQTNPAMLEDETTKSSKLKSRVEALKATEKEAAYYNYLTKDCNIPCDAGNVNSMVSMEDVRACIVPKIDWRGRNVVVGVDLSEIDDNSSVVMGDADISQTITMLDHTFIPEFYREQKERIEREPYSEHIKAGICTATKGTRVINYQEIVDYICGLEAKYGVKILAIGYDPHKATQLVEALNAKGFTTIEGSHYGKNRSISMNMLLYMMRSRAFRYERSDLLLHNFRNAKINYSGQETLNPWFDKKHAAGKVDIVAATIYMIQTALAVKDIYRPTVGVVASVPRRHRY